MRCISAFLVLGLGTVSVAWGEKVVAGGQSPTPSGPTPAGQNSASQSAAKKSSAASNCTAITESTEAGRQIAAPTADHPAYVIIHYGGRHDFGSPIAEKSAPTPESLIQQMESSLAGMHYLPTDAQHPPSLLIVFSWGIHGVPGESFDDPGHRNVLDRAALVGGNGFADELKKVLEQTQAFGDATPTGRWGPQQAGTHGQTVAGFFQSANPFEIFRRRDQKTEDLLVQLSNDCYYVVISAFDYATVGQGKRQLLWRTKLTAAAPGIAMADAIPTLIANGSGYFGRNMTEAEFFSSRDR